VKHMFEFLHPLFVERSGAASTAAVYALEMINGTQVLVKGATPTGTGKDGYARWKGATDHKQCVVSLDEYRALCEADNATGKGQTA
jgi:hypothetical protein